MTGILALVPVAYLLGTFPSAVIVARASGVDITKVGSGNPGASNVARVLGWQRGALVYVLDAAKGAAAAAIGLWVHGLAGAYLLIAAALLGHMFPVTRRFKGGKGIATAGGAMLVMHPVISAALTIVWYLVSRLTRRASVASIVVTVAMPVGVWLDGGRVGEIAAIGAIGGLVLLRHLPNLKRLAAGEELTMGR